MALLTWKGMKLMQQLQLRNIAFCVILPFAGIVQSFYQPIIWQTMVLAVALYIVSGIGITAGYHRLWSHRSFVASFTLRILLSIAGASSVQGSILMWCRDHRVHHRYVDTPKDPHNANRGFLWSHMGWLIFKPDPEQAVSIDISDLQNDKVVMWQHKYFAVLCLITAYALPSAVAEIGWNDGLGGLIYAGVLRAFLFQQSTNCVNSLAHYLGDQPYADSHSPRDHLLTALITFGEGYHNFHHEFPSDYRNGVNWFDYDPTKWCIRLCAVLGLAHSLQRFEPNEIDKAVFQQKQKHFSIWKKRIHWGPPVDSLPVYTWDDFKALSDERCTDRKYLVCIAGILYDVSGFVDSHPGGADILFGNIGRDITTKFHGGVYSHSKAASNLLHNMRFGVLRYGLQVQGVPVEDKDGENTWHW